MTSSSLEVMRRWLRSRWLRLAALTTVIGCLLSVSLSTQAVSTANADGSPAWATPTAMAIRRVGPTSDIPNQPNFQSNLDCAAITYRQVNHGDMRAGCFMSTAYGLVDPDHEMVIFNGTDEALPLLPYAPHQVLTPWPGTADALTLDAALTGGSYLGLYRNLVSALRDQRDPLAQLLAKQLSSPPDAVIHNNDGTNMVVNPQTMAFSTGGSWLVVETLTGSFVRINLATLDSLAFASAYGSQGSPALLKSQVTISRNGRYVAIENDVAGSFKVYDLSTCQGDVSSLKPLSCLNYDYWTFINAQITGLNRVSHVRFINNGLLSFTATSSSGTEIFELAPRTEISSLINFLALGDSYTSGEGAYDYLTGTDTSSNSCHLSLHSYPLLLTQLLYGGSGGHSVACSGARSEDLSPQNYGRYKGQASGVPLSELTTDITTSVLADFTPGNLPQADFVSQYQPGILTVSIGGNDIGFADILKNCVMPHLGLHPSDNICYSSYEDRLELKNLIDRMVPKWVSVFSRLRTASPISNLYVVGYPQIAYSKGDCALNVRLAKSELEFSVELINYLNDTLRQAASMAGANYIDISEALSGYRLCETASYNVAVNGLTAGKDSGALGLRLIGRESYHPTAFGHHLIEAAILKQTSNLRGTLAIAASNTAGQTWLNVPKTGRQIQTLIPSNSLTQSVITRGGTANLSVDGLANGLVAGATYKLSLDRAKGPIITSVIAGQSGDLAVSFRLPRDIEPGGHTVDVVGLNQVGQMINISQSLYVAANDSDADGDGIIDVDDACPGAVNSGHDSDQDGIDDVCDGFIGQTKSNGVSGGVVSGNISTNGSRTTEIIPPVAESVSRDTATPDQGSARTRFSSLPSPIVENQTQSSVPTPIAASTGLLGASTSKAAVPRPVKKTLSPVSNPSPSRRLNFDNWLLVTGLISLSLTLLVLLSWSLRQVWFYVRRARHWRLGRKWAAGFSH